MLIIGLYIALHSCTVDSNAWPFMEAYGILYILYVLVTFSHYYEIVRNICNMYMDKLCVHGLPLNSFRVFPHGRPASVLWIYGL